MHVEVKTLAPAVQAALKDVRYGARDIEVKVQSEVALQSGASWKGARGFIMAIDLDTGARTNVQHGNWGGANMFVRNDVDETQERYVLPPNGAVIKGQTGHPRTFATIYVHPAQMARFLPVAPVETSELDQQALYCFVALRGGEYRRQELARKRITADVLNSLVERGLLSRNKAGAMAITTAGRNAFDGKTRY